MKYIFSLIFISLFVFTSCNKNEYAYKSFIGDHEIIYAGLAEAISPRSGNLRVQVEWKKSIDPTVVTYTLFWNNNVDSVQIPASAINPNGTYRYVVTNLPEYVQSFKMITTNNRGDRSIGQTLNNVRVFGPLYVSSLVNKKASTQYVRQYFGMDSVRIFFIPIDATSIYSRIRFINKNGVMDSVTFVSDSVTVKSFRAGTKPTIQSYYMPTTNSIDTFKTFAADSLASF